MKIYIAPQSEIGVTTLQANVATWRALVALRPMPRDDSLRRKARPGELMSQAAWRDTATTIIRAIGDRDDGAVVRVHLPEESAVAVVEMAKEQG